MDYFVKLTFPCLCANQDNQLHNQVTFNMQLHQLMPHAMILTHNMYQTTKWDNQYESILKAYFNIFHSASILQIIKSQALCINAASAVQLYD